MQVILQGSLRHFPPAELLRFLAAEKHSGTIDLQSTDGRKTRVLLRDGSLLRAESDGAPDTVNAIAACLAWDGAFAMVDAVAIPEGVAVQPAAVDHVIAAAEELIAKANSFDDATMFRVNADKAQVTMSGDEFKIVLRIANGIAFKDLLPGSGQSRQELTALLKTMEEKGLLIREEPKPPAPPPPIAALDPGDRTVMVAKRRMASLTGDNGDVLPLIEDTYTIGRDPATNSIPLTDSSISTHHARITRGDETFIVEDLGSRNGTFVNGEKIAAPTALVDNDVIRFGRVILIFNLAREVRPGETTERAMRK